MLQGVGHGWLSGLNIHREESKMRVEGKKKQIKNRTLLAKKYNVDLSQVVYMGNFYDEKGKKLPLYKIVDDLEYPQYMVRVN